MHLFYIRKMQNKSIIRHLDPTVNVSALNLQYGLGYIYSKELHKYKHHPNVCGTDFTIRTEITRFASQMNNNIFKILNFSKQTYIDFSILFFREWNLLETITSFVPAWPQEALCQLLPSTLWISTSACFRLLCDIAFNRPPIIPFNQLI